MILAILLAVVSSTYTPGVNACNGVQAAFTIGFPYLANTISAQSTTAGGATTPLVAGVDYTLSAVFTTTSATLTLTNPASSCPNGNTLKILRNTPLTQPVHYTLISGSLAETGFDRAAMQAQETASLVSNGSTVTAAPITGTGSAGNPVTCTTASTSSTGCLSSTDWNTFNNKSSNGVSLSSANTWTRKQTFATGTATEDGIASTGNTTGVGVRGTGGGTNAAGGSFTGGATNGSGVISQGTGSGNGETATGGATGNGVVGTGGGTSGAGVVGTGTGGGNGGTFAGQGAGIGAQGTGGATGIGLKGIGGATSGDGVSGVGTAGNGNGVSGTGQGSGSGILGNGGTTGNGVTGAGGATSGNGVVGTGSAGGNFNGVQGTATGTGNGVQGTAASAAGFGVLGNGVSSGIAVKGTGFTGGTGVSGTAGPTTGTGVQGSAPSIGGDFSCSGLNCTGVHAVGGGSGTGAGLAATGNPTGPGVTGTGGATSGDGVQGTGTGTGNGVTGTGSTSGNGVAGTGGNSAGAVGVLGTGGSTNGVGVKGVGVGSGEAGNFSSAAGTGYGEKLTGNATRAPLNLAPATADVSTPGDGDLQVSGATTAMTLKARLNGATQPVLTSGVVGSAAVQTKRGVAGCTTAASIGATCSTTVTWTTPFPDANYTVTCNGFGGAGVPAFTNSNAKVAASISVVTTAITAVAASFGTIECISVHD